MMFNRKDASLTSSPKKIKQLTDEQTSSHEVKESEGKIHVQGSEAEQFVLSS